jgi:hypothetical protein
VLVHHHLLDRIDVLGVGRPQIAHAKHDLEAPLMILAAGIAQRARQLGDVIRQTMRRGQNPALADGRSPAKIA